MAWGRARGREDLHFALLWPATAERHNHVDGEPLDESRAPAAGCQPCPHERCIAHSEACEGKLDRTSRRRHEKESAGVYEAACERHARDADEMMSSVADELVEEGYAGIVEDDFASAFLRQRTPGTKR